KIEQQEGNRETAKELMRTSNPKRIPRNHLVEEAIKSVVEHEDWRIFNTLLEAMKTPYEKQDVFDSWLLPPDARLELNYKTFCGT
ncbi:hypothetical protein RZS08_64570, partial [Arthrospira platensis SPKY1]|nr:hypothetical protein [Arthrospira platensis SPKY1]